MRSFAGSGAPIAGHTVHGMPQIGEITPGLWLLGGFGGHGLAATAMGGEMLARAIVDNDRAWQMFSPFALVWAGGALTSEAGRVKPRPPPGNVKSDEPPVTGCRTLTLPTDGRSL